MEELERNLSSNKSHLKDEYTNENILYITSHSSNTIQDSAIDDGINEIHQICRGCLSTTALTNMEDTFVGGIAITKLYEDISQLKINPDCIPSIMCSTCVLELIKIDKFVKMLKCSYQVLLRVSEEICKLNDEATDDYNIRKRIILNRALSDKWNDLPMDVINIQIDDGNVNLPEENGDSFSDKGGLSNNYDSESSDDEMPLSQRFKINAKRKGNVSETRKRKAIQRKPSRKCKENVENSVNNSTILDSIQPINDLNNKDELKSQNICPLCSKNTRFFIKHLHSMHWLDWNNSICLKCSFYELDKEKLVDHSRMCTKTEPKDDVPEHLQIDDLKVEWKDEIDDADDCNPDFEMDEPDQDNFKESDEEQPEPEPKKYSSNKKKRGKNYTCNKCDGISFKKYEFIEEHLKTVHSEETNCILCDHQSKNFYSLLYHVMIKHGKVKCCRLCLVSFKNSDEQQAHYQSEEHNTKCTMCGEQFKNRKGLYEHRRKKHLNPQLENKKFKCPECPKEFANQNNIRRHIMVAHNDLRFLCDTCGQSYTTKRNLKLHIQKFHEGIQVENKNTKKNFFCETCGRELKIFHKYAIAMHRAKHKGHNYVCKKCYDSFTTEEDFKTHVDTQGHHLFECKQCQAQFVREENYKIHLKNHDAPGWNKNMFATWGKSAKLRNEKGEFVCSYCPKVFKDKQRLDNHVRVHTNERPYKCHICSKGFKTWIHRKTHLNIHLGIKKWVCKYCSKAFTNSCTLKGHEMIHTGERPHRCPECKKGFITLSAMKKHGMVHLRTTGSNYNKKQRSNTKELQRSDSEHEDGEFMYKYGQMFAGSEVSYESFTEEPKETLVSIEKELSC